MSQDASSTSTRPTPTQPLPTWTPGSSSLVKSGSFSVESYADRLMDELFEDVEHSLEQGNNHLVEPEPETVPVQSALPPELVQPAESPLLVVQPDPQPLMLEFEDESSELALPLPPIESRPPQPQSRSYDRFLLSFGCLALVAAGVLWLVLRVKQPSAPIAAAPQPTANPLSPADNQFAEYLKQSLQALAERSPSAPSSSKPGTANPATSPLPGVPVLKTPAIPARTAITGLGQLAAPVYQLPPNLMPKTPVAPTAAPPVAPTTTAMRSPTPATPTVNKTLVGVMELGDRSVALVEIAGVVQRFRIGESINASGWTLVEISKNQAVIRRNGEVRSIYTGQAF
jgi:cytoskeletal protein RodZ